jgi:hypothetical protein
VIQKFREKTQKNLIFLEFEAVSKLQLWKAVIKTPPLCGKLRALRVCSSFSSAQGIGAVSFFAAGKKDTSG